MGWDKHPCAEYCVSGMCHTHPRLEWYLWLTNSSHLPNRTKMAETDSQCARKGSAPFERERGKFRRWDLWEFPTKSELSSKTLQSVSRDPATSGPKRGGPKNAAAPKTRRIKMQRCVCCCFCFRQGSTYQIITNNTHFFIQFLKGKKTTHLNRQMDR